MSLPARMMQDEARADMALRIANVLAKFFGDDIAMRRIVTAHIVAQLADSLEELSPEDLQAQFNGLRRCSK